MSEVCGHPEANREEGFWMYGDRNRYAMSDRMHDSWEMRRVVRCSSCRMEWVEVKTLQVKQAHE